MHCATRGMSRRAHALGAYISWRRLSRGRRLYQSAIEPQQDLFPGVRRALARREKKPRYEDVAAGALSGGAAGPTRHARVQLPRAAGHPGQHQGLAGSNGSCGHPELPLARFAAYLGELARAGWDAVTRPPGAWGVGIGGNGQALCTLREFALGAVRGALFAVRRRKSGGPRYDSMTVSREERLA